MTVGGGGLKLVREPVSSGEFADAMSALASGIVLVTCRLGGRPWGMTVTAFASVSAEPPTVLVSVGTQTAGARAIAEEGLFGVSLLAEEHVGLARYGSTPGAAKFLESPIVAGALAHFDCEVVDAVEVADHIVFFGRVRAARASHDGAPLVYHRRGYRTLAYEERTIRCLSN